MENLASRLIAENKKTRATSLDLGNCGLTEVPAEIRDLVWLEELYFSNSWGIGEKWISSTKNETPNDLQRLTPSISATVNDFRDEAPVSDFWLPLINLKTLRSNGRWDIRFGISDLSPLAKLASLQSLDISHTQVSDLTPLAQLTNLQSLRVFGTQVDDLDPLKGLTNLQLLDVSGTPV